MLVRRIALPLLLAAAFAVCSAETYAASFDCAKAKTPDETAVCRNRELSELDTEMGALWFSYRQLPFLMGASGARRDDAGTFLARRAACGPRVSCLRDLYHARNKALRDAITAAITQIKREQQK
jgi:uncharacterized protein